MIHWLDLSFVRCLILDVLTLFFACSILFIVFNSFCLLHIFHSCDQYLIHCGTLFVPFVLFLYLLCFLCLFWCSYFSNCVLLLSSLLLLLLLYIVYDPFFTFFTLSWFICFVYLVYFDLLKSLLWHNFHCWSFLCQTPDMPRIED